MNEEEEATAGLLSLNQAYSRKGRGSRAKNRAAAAAAAKGEQEPTPPSPPPTHEGASAQEDVEEAMVVESAPSPTPSPTQLQPQPQQVGQEQPPQPPQPPPPPHHPPPGAAVEGVQGAVPLVVEAGRPMADEGGGGQDEENPEKENEDEDDEDFGDVKPKPRSKRSRSGSAKMGGPNGKGWCIIGTTKSCTGQASYVVAGVNPQTLKAYTRSDGGACHYCAKTDERFSTNGVLDRLKCRPTRRPWCKMDHCSKEACLVDERTGILSVCTQHGSDEEWRRLPYHRRLDDFACTHLDRSVMPVGRPGEVYLIDLGVGQVVEAVGRDIFQQVMVGHHILMSAGKKLWARVDEIDAAAGVLRVTTTCSAQAFFRDLGGPFWWCRDHSKDQPNAVPMRNPKRTRDADWNSTYLQFVQVYGDQAFPVAPWRVLVRGVGRLDPSKVTSIAPNVLPPPPAAPFGPPPAMGAYHPPRVSAYPDPSTSMEIALDPRRGSSSISGGASAAAAAHPPSEPFITAAQPPPPPPPSSLSGLPPHPGGVPPPSFLVDGPPPPAPPTSGSGAHGIMDVNSVLTGPGQRFSFHICRRMGKTDQADLFEVEAQPTTVAAAGEEEQQQQGSGVKVGQRLIFKVWRETGQWAQDAWLREKRMMQVADEAACPYLARGLPEHHFMDEASGRYILATSRHGTLLEEILRQHPDGSQGSRITLSRVVKWGACIARALMALHSQGIIHNDIHARNIIITDDHEAALLSGFSAALSVDPCTKTASTKDVLCLRDLHLVSSPPELRRVFSRVRDMLAATLGTRGGAADAGRVESALADALVEGECTTAADVWAWGHWMLGMLCSPSPLGAPLPHTMTEDWVERLARLPWEDKRWEVVFVMGGKFGPTVTSSGAGDGGGGGIDEGMSYRLATAVGRALTLNMAERCRAQDLYDLLHRDMAGLLVHSRETGRTYRIGKMLTDARAGTTYEAVDVHGGQPYAIKVFQAAVQSIMLGGSSDEATKCVAIWEREVSLLASIAAVACPYHIKMVEAFVDAGGSGLRCIVTEHVGSTSLDTMLSSGLRDVLRWARQLAIGLDALTTTVPTPIVHGDLMPRSTMLVTTTTNTRDIIMAGDVGLLVPSSHQPQHFHHLDPHFFDRGAVATIFVPPEARRSTNGEVVYPPGEVCKYDMWGYGVCIYLLALKAPMDVHELDRLGESSDQDAKAALLHKMKEQWKGEEEDQQVMATLAEVIVRTVKVDVKQRSTACIVRLITAEKLRSKEGILRSYNERLLKKLGDPTSTTLHMELSFDDGDRDYDAFLGLFVERQKHVVTAEHIANGQLPLDGGVKEEGMSVIVGPAGSGKTTLLHYLAHHLATKGSRQEVVALIQARDLMGPEGEGVETHLLGRWERALAHITRAMKDGDLAEELLQLLAMSYPYVTDQEAVEEAMPLESLFSRSASRAEDTTSLTLLVDGLQEVGELGARKLLHALSLLATTNHQQPPSNVTTRVIVSTRPEVLMRTTSMAAVPPLPTSVSILELLPPDITASRQLLTSRLPVGHHISSASATHADIHRVAHLFSGCPALLCCAADFTTGAASAGDAELYEKAMQALLTTKCDDDKTAVFLGLLAILMAPGLVGNILVSSVGTPQDTLDRALHDMLSFPQHSTRGARSQADLLPLLLLSIPSSSAFIGTVPHGPTFSSPPAYTFLHPGMQHYLAARYLSLPPEDTTRLLRDFIATATGDDDVTIAPPASGYWGHVTSSTFWREVYRFVGLRNGPRWLMNKVMQGGGGGRGDGAGANGDGPSPKRTKLSPSQTVDEWLAGLIEKGADDAENDDSVGQGGRLYRLGLLLRACCRRGGGDGDDSDDDLARQAAAALWSVLVKQPLYIAEDLLRHGSGPSSPEEWRLYSLPARQQLVQSACTHAETLGGSSSSSSSTTIDARKKLCLLVTAMGETSVMLSPIKKDQAAAMTTLLRLLREKVGDDSSLPDDFHVRALGSLVAGGMAVSADGHQVADAMEALLSIRFDPDAQVRASLATVLGSLLLTTDGTDDGGGKRVVECLLKLLVGPGEDSRVRKAALDSLVIIKGEKSGSGLIEGIGESEILGDADLSVRQCAQRSLEALARAAGVVDAAMDLVKHEEWGVRQAAAIVLGEAAALGREKEAVDALVKLVTGDVNEAVRRAAVLALGRRARGTEEGVVEALAERVADLDKGVREAVAGVIAKVIQRSSSSGSGRGTGAAKGGSGVTGRLLGLLIASAADKQG